MRTRITAATASLSALPFLLLAQGGGTNDDVNLIGNPHDPAPLGIPQILGLFVAIPLGLFCVIAIIVYVRRSGSGAYEYRPGRPWRFEAEWYGARPEQSDQPRAAMPGAGGASGSW